MTVTELEEQVKFADFTPICPVKIEDDAELEPRDPRRWQYPVC